jgi:serine/threonine protein kinase
MELVEGETLDARVPSGGLPVAQVLDIAWAVADALTAAHAKNIVHRDLKPANVMITQDDRVKVLDFGLAKMQDEENVTGSDAQTIAQTGAGIVMGTVPYMSPEQIEGKPADQRSDLFSFGVVLHELTAGRRPFEGASPAALLSSILRDPAPELRAERPDAPPAFADLVRQCLEKNPDLRIQTAREVRDNVDAIRRGVDSGRATPVAARPSSDAARTVGTDPANALAEAERLTDEGTRALQFGSSGGPAHRSNLEQARIFFQTRPGSDARARQGAGPVRQVALHSGDVWRHFGRGGRDQRPRTHHGRSGSRRSVPRPRISRSAGLSLRRRRFRFGEPSRGSRGGSESGKLRSASRSERRPQDPGTVG